MPQPAEPEAVRAVSDRLKPNPAPQVKQGALTPSYIAAAVTRTLVPLTRGETLNPRTFARTSCPPRGCPKGPNPCSEPFGSNFLPFTVLLGPLGNGPFRPNPGWWLCGSKYLQFEGPSAGYWIFLLGSLGNGRFWPNPGQGPSYHGSQDRKKMHSWIFFSEMETHSIFLVIIVRCCKASLDMGPYILCIWPVLLIVVGSAILICSNLIHIMQW